MIRIIVFGICIYIYIHTSSNFEPENEAVFRYFRCNLTLKVRSSEAIIICPTYIHFEDSESALLPQTW